MLSHAIFLNRKHSHTFTLILLLMSDKDRADVLSVCGKHLQIFSYFKLCYFVHEIRNRIVSAVGKAVLWLHPHEHVLILKQITFATFTPGVNQHCGFQAPQKSDVCERCC